MITQIKTSDSSYHLYYNRNGFGPSQKEFRALTSTGKVIDFTLHSGKPVEVNEELEFYSLERVGRVSGYVNSIGEKISPQEFNDNIARLKENFSDGKFDDLDSEYAYRKYIQEWTPLSFTHFYQSPEPYPVEKLTALSDTGSKWVVSDYSIGGVPCSYHIELSKFTENIIDETCAGLGIKLVEESKKGEKTYSKSYNMNYYRFFGRYIFGDDISFPKIFRGTLEQCNKRLSEVKGMIVDKITSYHSALYKNLDKNEVGELLSDIMVALNNVHHHVRYLDVKAKSKYSQDSTLSDISLNIKKIEEFLKKD